MLGENSAAGTQFRNAMAKLLTSPRTWEASPDGHAQRASLMSRACSEIRSADLCRRKKGWKAVLPACSFWFRTALVDGEYVTLFGMRWELTHQIGVDLPGVTDQTSLTALGTRYGVINSDPRVPTKVQHGDDRIAVLTSSFVDPLLAIAGGRFQEDEADT